MRNKVWLVAVVSVAAVGGCKKGDGGGGGGGGGGGWLVGDSALMANVLGDGTLGTGYQLADTASLYGIACRDTSATGQAWVVGDRGTLLYTADAGDTWTAQAAPSQATLRAVATMDAGPLFVAGDGTFLTSSDDGTTWTSLVDTATASTSFRAVSTAEGGNTVLAVSADGGVWTLAAGTSGSLTQLSMQLGARSIGVADDGSVAILAGNGLARSSDGGHTWTQLAVDPSLAFDEAWVDVDGTAVAVGTGGAVANIDADGQVTIQHVATADLHTIHIGDDGFGLTGGDDGQTAITEDFGATWTAGPTLAHAVRSVDELGAGHR